jgi:Acetyltransferase (GNAT) domain
MTEPARFDAIRTDRLVMRRWLETDRAPFAVLNADPQTMRFLPETLDRAASDALIDRIEMWFDRLGYGLWALEVAQSGEFIGFTGINPMPAGVPGGPEASCEPQLRRQCPRNLPLERDIMLEDCGGPGSARDAGYARLAGMPNNLCMKIHARLSLAS